MKAFLLAASRIAMVAFCGSAVWWSVRIAVADWAASSGTMEGFTRAMRIAPTDPELRAREALYRNETDDAMDPSVDAELRYAGQLNPFDSNILMTLGMREEVRGDHAAAEKDLKRAVEIDRQFKPAWTLANFYYRAGEPEKSTPLLKQILNLEPLGFDPGPVFALAWQEAGKNDETSSGHQILQLLPNHGERRVQYLRFLMRTKRTAAALEAWPLTLAVLNAGDPEQAPVGLQFTDFLIEQGHFDDAVRVWNDLSDRELMKADRLAPEKGISIADPEFQFPLDGAGFRWRAPDIAGVYISRIANGLRVEISGEEPENFAMLSAFAPVRRGKVYRLRWNSDGSALSSSHDPGFAFQIVAGMGDGTVIAQCGPMLSSEGKACEFVSPDDADGIRVRLHYLRASGTVRVSGVLQLDSVRLELSR